MTAPRAFSAFAGGTASSVDSPSVTTMTTSVSFRSAAISSCSAFTNGDEGGATREDAPAIIIIMTSIMASFSCEAKFQKSALRGAKLAAQVPARGALSGDMLSWPERRRTAVQNVPERRSSPRRTERSENLNADVSATKSFFGWRRAGDYRRPRPRAARAITPARDRILRSGRSSHRASRRRRSFRVDPSTKPRKAFLVFTQSRGSPTGAAAPARRGSAPRNRAKYM